MTTTDTHPTNVLVPRVLWAQRHDRVYLTIEIFGVKDEKISLSANSLEFSGTRSEDNANFAVHLEFFDAIVSEQSQKSITGRNVAFILIKEKDDQPYWPRLIKDTKKMHYIAVDFAKWCDEDEEGGDDGKDFGGMGDFGNFDPSQFANMGNDDYEEDDDSLYKDDEDEEEEEEGEKADAEEMQ